MNRVFSLIFLAMILPIATYAVDMNEVEKELTTTGVEGWIHAAVVDKNLYVFTYRSPSNFFDYVEMSLVAKHQDIAKQLATFIRHDKVRVKGSFLDNPSGQKHIAVTSIELITKYQSGYPTQPYSYQAKVPDDLLNKTSETFFVHAVDASKPIMVVEYQDVVLPVFLKNGALIKNLYRNDLIQMNFKIQDRPKEPVHLDLDESVAQPIQVLDSIQAKNGRPASMEGALVLFPKSPEIITNIFAVEEDLPGGSKRQYTLVNFDDPRIFNQILATLQAEWDKFPGDYTNGRNKLVSNRIRVKVTGTFNEVDPGQANPQILLPSVNAIQFIEN